MWLEMAGIQYSLSQNDKAHIILGYYGSHETKQALFYLIK